MKRLIFLGLILSVFVAIDNLVPRLDWAYVNWHGWLAFSYYIVPWVALLIAPALILGKWSRWFYYMLLPLLSLIEVVTMFVRVNFKVQMDGAWLAIVLGTSMSEIRDFFAYYFGLTFILVGLLVVAFNMMAVRVVTLWSKEIKGTNRLRFWAGVGCLALFAVMTQVWKSPMQTFESRTSVFFLADGFRKLSDYRKLVAMKNAPQLPACKRIDRMDDSSLGVIVIGESATRNRWHLYGYDRDTTPCMDAIKDELIVFADVKAAVIYTAQAMSLMMTTATAERPDDLRYAFPQLLRQVGFRTSLYSAQERLGVFLGTEMYAFAGCDEQVFLGEESAAPFYDDALLPFFVKFISNEHPLKPGVVFLHLNGSHHCPADRYPSDFMPFRAEPITSSRRKSDVGFLSPHYDNSIAFTDKLLGEIVSKLKQRKAVSWMVYLSDHGESPNNKEWRLATSRDTWEVPMIVWVSHEYRARFPEVVKRLEASARKKLRTDHVLPILEELSLITVNEAIDRRPSISHQLPLDERNRRETL